MVLNITQKNELKRSNSKGFNKLVLDNVAQKMDIDIDFQSEEKTIVVNGKEPAEELDKKDVIFIDNKIGMFGDAKNPLQARVRIIFCDNEMLVELVEGACLISDTILPQNVQTGRMLIFKKVDRNNLPNLDEFTDQSGKTVTNERWLSMSELKEICSNYVKYGKYVSDYMFDLTLTCKGNSVISYKKENVFDISNGVFAQMDYNEELRVERNKRNAMNKAFMSSMLASVQAETTYNIEEIDEYEEDDDDWD